MLLEAHLAQLVRATLYATPTPLQNLAPGRELLDNALTLARESKDRATETKILWNLMLIEYIFAHSPDTVRQAMQNLPSVRVVTENAKPA